MALRRSPCLQLNPDATRQAHGGLVLTARDPTHSPCARWRPRAPRSPTGAPAPLFARAEEAANVSISAATFGFAHQRRRRSQNANKRRRREHACQASCSYPIFQVSSVRLTVSVPPHIDEQRTSDRPIVCVAATDAAARSSVKRTSVGVALRRRNAPPYMLYHPRHPSWPHPERVHLRPRCFTRQLTPHDLRSHQAPLALPPMKCQGAASTPRLCRSLLAFMSSRRERYCLQTIYRQIKEGFAAHLSRVPS